MTRPNLLVFICALLIGMSSSQNRLEGDFNGQRLQPTPSYLIMAPRRIRPDQVVQVRAHVFRLDYSRLSVRVSIRKDGDELASSSEAFTSPSARMMQLQVPEFAEPGNYTMHVQGSTDRGVSAIVFQNETALLFSRKRMSIFIQTDKLIYQKKSTVRFRVIAVKPNLLPVMSGSVDIHVRDAGGNVAHRWLSKQLYNGVYEGSIPIGHPVKFGWWTIEVSSRGQFYKKQFKLENYFYSRYDINISMPAILYDNEHSLAGVISANETMNGMPVKGSGKIELEIRHPQWTKDDYPVITKQIPMIHGSTSFIFTLEEMRRLVPTLAGAELVIKVSLQHWHIREEKSSTAHALIYSCQPHFKFLGGRVRTFKPWVPLNVYIAAYQEDGSPYVNTLLRQLTIYVSVRELGGRVITLPKVVKLIPDSSIVKYTYVPQRNDELVLIRTAPDAESQKFVELAAYRHYTRTNHYIHVTSSTSDPEVNRYMVFMVRSTVYVPEIHYQVLANGNIIVADTLFMTSQQKSFALAVSREMTGSARILVYAKLTGGELLADSLSFHVKGVRGDGLTLKVNKGKDFTGDTVELNAATDPGTFTTFSAAKYSLYRLAAHSFITQHQVEEDLLEYDKVANQSFRHTWYTEDNRKQDVYFHAPDMAIDPNTTFTFAGLLIFTDATVTRISGAELCNASLGYLPCFSGSCFHVSQQCDNHWDCEDGADEMGCDRDIEEFPVHRPDEVANLGRIYSHLDGATWAWHSSHSKPNGRVDLKVSPPLEPEPWVITGLSLSKERGLAFNDIPVRFNPTQAFYVVMEMPSAAFRGEQIGVQLAVHNYWSQPLEALLTLKSSSAYKFISVGSNGQVSSYDPTTVTGDVQTMVSLLPGKSRFVHFPILPTVLGKVRVTIKADSFVRSQTVSKTVSIAMDGVTNKYHTPMLIDLVNKGSSIIPDLWIPVPERFIYPGQREHLYVPGSQKATLTISGDVVGPGYFTSYLDSYKVFDRVFGLAFQHLFNFGTNLYWLKYLKAMNMLPESRMNSVLTSMNKEKMIFNAFINKDGGMTQHKKTVPSSVWVTSLALELMALATEPEWEHILYMDPNVFNKMADWLVQQQNSTTGAFRQTAGFQDHKLRSNLTNKDGLPMNISLTAYSVVALTKAVPILRGKTQTMAEAARFIAADYLADNFPKLKDPFEICLVTYALHVANHRAKSNAFLKMRSVRRENEYVYWSSRIIPPNPTQIINTVPQQHPKPLPLPHESKAIEGTAYALMVYLMNNWFVESAPIMKWLQTRRASHSGFDGDRDSLLATQALIAYATRETNKDLRNILINVQSTAKPDWKKEIYLKKSDFIRYQHEKIPDVWGAVESYAMGNGYALIQMTTEVNVEYPSQLRKPEVEAFSLEVDSLKFSGRNSSIMEMNVCITWLATHISPTSGSSVVEIDIPTGFFARKSLLKRYQKVGRINIERARFTKQKVVWYMDKIDTTRSCWYFSAERWFPVANSTIQHRIRVYDISEPALQNTTIFTTYGLFHNHICQVCGSFQCPYCPFYNTAPCAVLSYKFFSVTIMALFYVTNKMSLSDFGLF